MFVERDRAGNSGKAGTTEQEDLVYRELRRTARRLGAGKLNTPFLVGVNSIFTQDGTHAENYFIYTCIHQFVVEAKINQRSNCSVYTSLVFMFYMSRGQSGSLSTKPCLKQADYIIKN